MDVDKHQEIPEMPEGLEVREGAPEATVDLRGGLSEDGGRILIVPEGSAVDLRAPDARRPSKITSATPEPVAAWRFALTQDTDLQTDAIERFYSKNEARTRSDREADEQTAMTVLQDLHETRANLDTLWDGDETLDEVRALADRYRTHATVIYGNSLPLDAADGRILIPEEFTELPALAGFPVGHQLRTTELDGASLGVAIAEAAAKTAVGCTDWTEFGHIAFSISGSVAMGAVGISWAVDMADEIEGLKINTADLIMGIKEDKTPRKQRVFQDATNA